MWKYRFYILSLVGLVVLFYGMFNTDTVFGTAAWFIGILISFIGVVLQIIFAPNNKH